MPYYEVTIMVEADNPANAILPILYPDGEPTRMKIDGISVVVVEDH